MISVPRSFTEASWLNGAEGGVRVSVRVQPKASRAAIDGIERRPDNRERLRVRVTAPPESGKANEAAMQCLAETWGLPERAFQIVSGGKSRDKTIFIAGDCSELINALGSWAQTQER